MKKKIIIPILMLILLILLTNTANAFSKTIIANLINGTDAPIRSGGATTNYGTGGNMWLGMQSGSDIRRGLVNLSWVCDDSNIAGNTITGFKYSVWQPTDASIPPATYSMEAYKVKTLWNEGTVTWNLFNAGGVNNTDYDGSYNLITAYTPVGKDIWVNLTFDTTYINSQCLGSGGVYQDMGILITNKVGEGADTQWYPSTSDDAGKEPRIYITWEIPTNEFMLTTYDKYNFSIIGATITINNATYTTTNISTGNITFNDMEGIYNITITSDNYTTLNYINYDTTNDLVANLTYYKARFKASNKFISNIDNSTLQGFNISFYNKNTTTIEKTANSTSGTITVDLAWNNTYNITIHPSGHEIKYITITTDTDYILSDLIYFFSKNSFNFIFLDEENKSLASNINLDLISDVFSQNYTAQNGTIYIDLLTPSLYALRYTSPSYNQKFYYYNLTANSFNNITLYLNKGTNVTATIYDEKGDKLEDAYVKVLRFDLATNSYIPREIAKTDFAGESTIHLILNTEFYKFLVYYPFSTLLKTTSPSYITSTSLSLSVDLNLPFGDTYFSSNNVDYSLTYNTDSSNFRFSYSDTASKVTTGCLEVYTLSVRGDKLYDSSCVNSDTSTILVSAPAVNGTTYEAKGYTTINDERVLLDSKTVVFDATQIGGDLGLLLVAFLTILFTMIAYYSIPTALIISPLPMFMGSLMNIVDIPMQVVIPLELMCVVLAITISKRSSQ